MKYHIVVSDPPWAFFDKLSMDEVKRGAESQYPVLNIEAIKKLNVPDITADDALLALWVPSSLLQEGLDTMKAWGFRQTQTHIWVKVKKEPFHNLLKTWGKTVRKELKEVKSIKDFVSVLSTMINDFNIHDTLAFGLGRLFRQTHEICLIGVKGKIYKHLKNKSQRSVHFAQNLKHSAKPEHLQDMLDLMFPDKSLEKLEMFARRPRAGWVTLGNQVFPTYNEDIRESIKKLINCPDFLLQKISSFYSNTHASKHDHEDLQKMWDSISIK